MSRPVRLSCLGLGLLLSGCPVDERTLREESVTIGGRPLTAGSAGADDSEAGAGGDALAGGAGGESSEAGQNAGGTNQAGTSAGGTSVSGGGQGGTGMVMDLACPDLDGNQVGDCKETLLRNARFDGDVTDWVSESAVEIEWSSRDLSGNESGSLAVRNTTSAAGPTVSMAGSTQCLAVVPGANYDVAARMFMEEGQSSGTSGIVLWFFDQAGCVGTQLAPFISPQVGQTEQWFSIAANATAPSTAQSVLVRLVVVKPVEAEPLEVFFDNVLFKQH